MKIGFKTACMVALGWRFGNFIADGCNEFAYRGAKFIKRYKDNPEEGWEYLKRKYTDRSETEKTTQKIKMGFM